MDRYRGNKQIIHDLELDRTQFGGGIGFLAASRVSLTESSIQSKAKVIQVNFIFFMVVFFFLFQSNDRAIMQVYH